jgi:hypothetical protein
MRGYLIRRHRPTEQVSDNTVVRCMAVPALPSGEESVIVKQVTSVVFNQSGSSGESQRLLNEWACLEFLATLPGDPGYGPRLFGSDRSHNVLVLEDLGQNRSVEDALPGIESESAQRSLVGVGGLLGRMKWRLSVEKKSSLRPNLDSGQNPLIRLRPLRNGPLR